jgi:hypothetical protein
VELSKHCERQNVLCRHISRSFFETSCRLVLSDGLRTKGREPGQSGLAKLQCEQVRDQHDIIWKSISFGRSVSPLG